MNGSLCRSGVGSDVPAHSKRSRRLCCLNNHTRSLALLTKIILLTLTTVNLFNAVKECNKRSLKIRNLTSYSSEKCLIENNFTHYASSFEFLKLNWCKKFYRSSRPQVFCSKDVLRNFAKFSGKDLCQNLFFNKVAGLCNFIKKETLAQLFSCEFCESSLNTFFLQNTSGGCFCF